MLPLYYYNKVEIASIFHIHVCRMWKTHRSHHPRRGRACPARALSHNHPLTFHIVGSGLDPSACPFPAGNRSPFHHPRRGRACPARNFAPPAVNPSVAHHPHNLCPPTAVTPIYTLPKLALKLCQKNQKTCKNLLTKVILLAIIIKLSREPSPRRQPLEPLPTACTPFFEENFFKKLSENLLTNERI